MDKAEINRRVRNALLNQLRDEPLRTAIIEAVDDDELMTGNVVFEEAVADELETIATFLSDTWERENEAMNDINRPETDA